MNDILGSITAYCLRNNLCEWHPAAALIDMDGVLYDSMPGHARAWKKMMTEEGVGCTVDEFFLYEGMTGKATIELLMRERLHRDPQPGEVERLYARKSQYFKDQGERKPMPGADRVLKILMEYDIRRVLVTGSAQESLLKSLEDEYPGAFQESMRVTAHDVIHGKPNPEPYLKGLAKGNAPATQTIVIENAPLGVESGNRAGCFTIAVTTGPVPVQALIEAGADIVFGSMNELADHLPLLLKPYFIENVKKP